MRSSLWLAGTTACKWDSIIPLEPMWEQLKRIIKPNGAIVLFGTEPFSSILRISNLDMFKYDIIWEKQKPSNFQLMNYQVGKVHETISIFSNGATSYTKNGNSMTYNPQYTGEPYKRKSKVYGTNTNLTLRDTGLYGKSLEEKEFNGKSPRSIIKFNVPIQNKKHPTQKPVDLMEYLIKTYSNEGETVLDFTMGSGTTGVAADNLNRSFIGIELNDNYYQISKDRILGKPIPDNMQEDGF